MKTWLQSKRFFVQILCITIGLLLFLCIIFTVILYRNSQRATTDFIKATEMERTNNLLLQSDIYWNQVISAASGFANLNISYDKVTSTNNFYANQLLDNMIHSHINANPYISNIDVFISRQSIYPSIVSHDKFLGRFFYFDIYTTDTITWPYSFDLVSDYGNNYRKVVITVDAFFLARYLFPDSDTARRDYLLTEDGTILLSSDKTATFQNISSIFQMPTTANTSKKAVTSFISSASSSNTPNTDGELTAFREDMSQSDLRDNLSVSTDLYRHGDHYYTLSAPDKYGFAILSLVPVSYYANHYAGNLFHTLLMSACLLLVAVAISIFLTVRFYRPVKQTMELLKTYIPDDLLEYENEIAFIQQSIAKYVGTPQPALSGITKTYSQIQNAQTAVLQYQINSHFLFNTLENIKAISVTELGMDNEIENSIILLNNIIREGVFQKNLIVNLSHELHLAKCYLELMTLRFPDVQVFWSVDESLSDCQVFKFSLQPILENCFTHAFKSVLSRKKEIHVHVEQASEDLLIKIYDNGVGLDQASALRLSEMLSPSGTGSQAGSSGTAAQTGSSGHTATQAESGVREHVGIYNIHKRITDIFGPNYGIRVEPGKPGIVVEIRYPVVPAPKGE